MQTLSILITNISKQTSMFFLFSNNHLNDIIGLGYDLRDEEVLAHFVTLLKTISFKLNKDTIQFFFQVDASNRYRPLVYGKCTWGSRGPDAAHLHVYAGIRLPLFPTCCD